MRPTEPAHPADRPRVLLVDPDQAMRAVVAQALLDGGCEVAASVPNYAQAMVSSRRDHPTVIVTELCEGAVLSPPQYLAALRRHSPAPVIVYGLQVPTAAEAAEWGLWAALPKGDVRRLLEAVRAAHGSAPRIAPPASERYGRLRW